MGVASYIAGRDFLPNLETKESIKLKEDTLKSSCKQETDSIPKATGILLQNSAVSEHGKTKERKSKTDTQFQRGPNVILEPALTTNIKVRSYIFTKNK